MITKQPSTVPGHTHITFELPSCIWADHIYLTGEFNHWDPRSLPMHQGRDGVWRLEIDLPCGYRYEFRYLVNGSWLTDSHADGLATNPYGTQNSIVDTALPRECCKRGVRT
ncbi:MAG: isoamylase early set domain-containing protein [Caldilineaceae bacterium]